MHTLFETRLTIVFSDIAGVVSRTIVNFDTCPTLGNFTASLDLIFRVG